ncbi:Uncharacterized protein HZ326_3890 [Fusarium oxysporum f. sp. albedinis]|nr:Uncharacterized protein HZ326_3890 [Fusarium oxysporum f. sp. albedinis]
MLVHGVSPSTLPFQILKKDSTAKNYGSKHQVEGGDASPYAKKPKHGFCKTGCSSHPTIHRIRRAAIPILSLSLPLEPQDIFSRNGDPLFVKSSLCSSFLLACLFRKTLHLLISLHVEQQPNRTGDRHAYINPRMESYRRAWNDVDMIDLLIDAEGRGEVPQDRFVLLSYSFIPSVL